MAGSRTGALMNYPCLFCPSDNFEHRFNRSKKIENKMAKCTSSVAGSRTALTVRRQARCFRLSPTTRHWLQHNHQNQSKKENVEGRVSIHKYSNECFLFCAKIFANIYFRFSPNSLQKYTNQPRKFLKVKFKIFYICCNTTTQVSL